MVPAGLINSLTVHKKLCANSSNKFDNLDDCVAVVVRSPLTVDLIKRKYHSAFCPVLMPIFHNIAPLITLFDLCFTLRLRESSVCLPHYHNTLVFSIITSSFSSTLSSYSAEGDDGDLGVIGDHDKDGYIVGHEAYQYTAQPTNNAAVQPASRPPQIK